MEDAEFVKRIWIVGGDVGDHEVGNQQLLKHVCADIPGLKNLAGCSAFGGNVLERRTDEILFDSVEVDAFAYAERTDDESSHGRRVLSSRKTLVYNS
jgi:hypothetical protein